MVHATLIPTDFSIESLALVRSALNSNNDQVHIVLAHGIDTGESISGLLFFSRANFLARLIKPGFRQALEDLKVVYGRQIASIRIELFFGDTQAAFAQFLEANNISQIFMPGDFRFRKPHRLSKDLNPFLNRSLQEKIRISWSVKRFDALSFSGAGN